MPVSMLLNAWFPKFFVSKRRTFTRKSAVNLNHIRNEQMKFRGFVDYPAWRSDRNIDLAVAYETKAVAAASQPLPRENPKLVSPRLTITM